MTTAKQDEDINRAIEYFRQRDEVSALYLFGSLVAGRQHEESDLDLAVLVDERKLKQVNYEALKRAYYAASAGFSLRIVDIVVLNVAPPYLKHQVLKTGKVLFDRNRRLRVRFTERAIMDYLDFKPVEEICLRSVARRFRGKTVGR
ncbi:MAG: type VII toxin-antitoxin system MntA family adenylyltransferase antitoxin [Chloroflexota bacterium]